MKNFMEKFRLTDKVSVITGGAGILGQETSKIFAEAGANVAICDLDIDTAVSQAKILSTKYGINAVGVECDVSSKSSTRDAIRFIEQSLGPIDVLHNNAATKGSNIDRMFDSVESYSLITWREIMAVNLDGMFVVAQEVGTKMAERGTGSIVQTSSIYGAQMGPDQRIYEGSEYGGRAINTPPVYSASKAGVHGLTLYLSTYWAQNGIRVNTVSPGGIFSGQNEEFVRKYSQRVPMQRMATASEIGMGVLFLASEASSYVTGQNLHIDGGMSAW